MIRTVRLRPLPSQQRGVLGEPHQPHRGTPTVVLVVLPGGGPEPLQRDALRPLTRAHIGEGDVTTTMETDTGVPPIFASAWPDPVVPPVSLPEFLLATAAEFADRPAIVDAVSGGTLRCSPRRPWRTPTGSWRWRRSSTRWGSSWSRGGPCPVAEPPRRDRRRRRPRPRRAGGRAAQGFRRPRPAGDIARAGRVRGRAGRAV